MKFLSWKGEGDHFSRNFACKFRATTTHHMISFIHFYFHFLANFPICYPYVIVWNPCEPGWAVVSRVLCRIDRVLSQSWRFYYTFLETSCKIKWNIQPPFPQHPPKSRMKPREGQIKKTCDFPILDLGGRGGLGFPFILSKIKWNSKPPSPPNEEWRRVKGKNSLFPHPGSGEWGV